MSALLLEVESRENLGPVVTEYLSLPTAHLTVSALIAERVRSTCSHLAPAEQEMAVSRALDAFRQNGFLLIVDDQRRTDPDERLQMTIDSRVRFWRLMRPPGAGPDQRAHLAAGALAAFLRHQSHLGKSGPAHGLAG